MSYWLNKKNRLSQHKKKRKKKRKPQKPYVAPKKYLPYWIIANRGAGVEVAKNSKEARVPKGMCRDGDLVLIIHKGFVSHVFKKENGALHFLPTHKKPHSYIQSLENRIKKLNRG